MILSRDCHLLQVIRCRSSKVHKAIFGLLQPLPGVFPWNCHFQVTSGCARSHDIISCHMTATYCELQRCRSSKHTKPSFAPSRATSRWLSMKSRHSDHFRSRQVTWHFLSRDCHLLRVSPVGAQTYPKPQFSAFYSHFQVTFGEMMFLPGHFRSCQVTGRHFLSHDCHLLRVTAL